jgi:hypothetical protein
MARLTGWLKKNAKRRLARLALYKPKKRISEKLYGCPALPGLQNEITQTPPMTKTLNFRTLAAHPNDEMMAGHKYVMLIATEDRVSV